MVSNKIGVGIVTCDRYEFMKNLLHSLQGCNYDKLIVVNDHADIIETPVDGLDVDIINNEENVGVGKAKNVAMQNLIDNECEHIFILEDDIKIIDNDVFQVYIDTAKIAGIKHMNFCLHGEDNKRQGEPAPKLILDYKDAKIALYHNIYGALSYYHVDALTTVGLMDEEYYNAMEHVDHTMQLILAGYHPPFRWFADVATSNKLIQEQDHNHEESKIRRSDEWLEQFKYGVERFYNKFGINVCGANQPTADKQEVIRYMKGQKDG